MRKIFLSIFMIVFALTLVKGIYANVDEHGIKDPNGIPLYVIIEVNWDGDKTKDGSWTVYGPLWNPVIAPSNILTSCPMGSIGSCLAMNYEFKFAGKTVQFDEVFVDTVTATPQVRHVVLHDEDGDGVYKGSESAEHYFPWRQESDGTWPILYFDRLDYELTFEDEVLTNFHYTQYEHKKLVNSVE